MSDVVYLFDTKLLQYWRASGQGHTPHIENAHPWDRVTAVNIQEVYPHIEVREIEPEDVLI